MVGGVEDSEHMLCLYGSRPGTRSAYGLQQTENISSGHRASGHFVVPLEHGRQEGTVRGIDQWRSGSKQRNVVRECRGPGDGVQGDPSGVLRIRFGGLGTQTGDRFPDIGRKEGDTRGVEVLQIGIAQVVGPVPDQIRRQVRFRIRDTHKGPAYGRADNLHTRVYDDVRPISSAR